MPSPARHDIRITGSGPAALTLARILSARADTTLWLDAPRPGAGATVLLNPTALALIDDVFGLGAQLARHGHRLCARRLRWGDDGETVVPMPALAIDGPLLARLMWDVTATPRMRIGCLPPAPCRFHAEARGGGDASPRADADALVRAGRRRALQARAEIADADDATATMEDLPSGWLFLLPLGRRTAVLQAVVPERAAAGPADLSALLRESRLIAPRLGAVDAAVRTFAAAPHLHRDAAAGDRLRLGDAALRHDPLCGDGTGQALRGGILAAAVLAEACATPAHAGAALEHYCARLRHAFVSHLDACTDFYGDSRHAAAWAGEIARMDRARRAIDPSPPPRFRLEGFALVPQ